ncbi:hypothetical protein PIB30_073173 [Stylosanthes scabra]|uniref:Bifunctional inhibitor/plant lipid transfer protein/seed storage helical domain-containing protein n=1 Tax=Stylosanthes scabra TaxID=79078 RepID=A0ABU6QPD8_9FABA|nr:hypothetical protein [Stylosanthes scabra]
MGSESSSSKKRLTSSSSMVALSLMTLIVLAGIDGSMAQLICNVSIGDLMTCKPAVTPPNPPLPTDECCTVLKKADIKCLCKYKNSTLLPALGIDPNLAMELPEKCKLPHPPQC